MANTLQIKKLQHAEGKAVTIPYLFKDENIEYQAISVGNWSDTFPYHPTVSFALAHDGKNIYIHYKVEENCVRGVEDADLGYVWEDSCCEFFMMPDEDGGYYNLEVNCIGSVLLCNGKGRESRQQASASKLARIDRWASLGTRALGLLRGDTSWELALVVPVSSFFNHKIAELSGVTMKANFYKCGDKTDQPHFLSWQKVDLPKPDFHRPEFFGTIIFE